MTPYDPTAQFTFEMGSFGKGNSSSAIYPYGLTPRIKQCSDISLGLATHKNDI